MTALFLVGDVRQRQAELIAAGERFDFILCSPPFLALRSYLPPDHPDKAKEIGSETTPAEFIDVLLELTAEWGQLLAPHGSIAIELGDTYAGSGGGGGDYYEDGMRAGQPGFTGSAGASRDALRDANAAHWRAKNEQRDAWPLDKSLACIPQLYQVALAYGRNPLRAPLSARELLDVAEGMADTYPDITVPTLLAMLRDWLDRYEETGPTLEYERWRVRNLKPWIRSNPPVGALGDKERPATSYVVVACRARDRWFDLDAVRTRPTQDPATYTGNGYTKGQPQGVEGNESMPGNAAGAPPRDWWHHVDAILDAELTARASDGPRHSTAGTLNKHPRGFGEYDAPNPGAQGVHLRRALERAGILTTQEALDISPKGYAGAHYAVWPPELVRQLVDEMCPRRVCVTCGQPSRRIVDVEYVDAPDRELRSDEARTYGSIDGKRHNDHRATAHHTTGWSDCGHDHWRPGRILDPFVGSGTTLAVASGMGRDATGIDIDERNAHLAEQRVGMFLTVHHPTREAAS